LTTVLKIPCGKVTLTLEYAVHVEAV